MKSLNAMIERIYQSNDPRDLNEWIRGIIHKAFMAGYKAGRRSIELPMEYPNEEDLKKIKYV